MLLKTHHIRKQFNGIYALDGIDFEIREGEVHGLVGENGAGKSTFIKILTGVYSLDEGEILWGGKPVRIANPSESRKLGISVIHQDHVLIPSFSGIENIYLGMEYPTKNGRIDWDRMRETAGKKAEELGIEIDLDQTAGELSPPQKTCLEIIRAMMEDCRLLILDEPTASLTDKEAEILFELVNKLSSRGTSILYVTHRMEEIFRLSDRITIFKNGRLSGVVNTAEIDTDGLIRMMTDDWESSEEKRESRPGEVCLKAEGIVSKDGIVKSGNIEARSGEILGLYGLGGSGRTELLECIYGYRAVSAGSVSIKGEKEAKLSPAASIRKGVVLISEDRRGKAMIGSLSIRENILLSSIDQYAEHGVLNGKKEREAVSEKAKMLEIKLASLDQRAIELSGGNQQKVVFAKAMMTDPIVYLCDEPTQAVDVKTRAEIHKLLREKAADGSAVIYVTSDLKEMLEVADRIQIISGGRTGTVLENTNLKSQDVLSLCYGADQAADGLKENRGAGSRCADKS